MSRKKGHHYFSICLLILNTTYYYSRFFSLTIYSLSVNICPKRSPNWLFNCKLVSLLRPLSRSAHYWPLLVRCVSLLVYGITRDPLRDHIRCLPVLRFTDFDLLVFCHLSRCVLIVPGEMYPGTFSNTSWTINKTKSTLRWLYFSLRCIGWNENLSQWDRWQLLYDLHVFVLRPFGNSSDNCLGWHSLHRTLPLRRYYYHYRSLSSFD